MRWWKAIVMAVTIAIAAIAVSPAISAARKAAPKAQPKIDPIKALVLMQAANRYHDGEDLAVACRRTNFKGLSYALTMNSSWLNSAKREFETSEEYADRSGKVATLMGGSQIIICQPLNQNEDAPFDYKADIEHFAGTLSPNQNVWRDVKQLGRFRTKTRMGIPFNVSASSEMSFDAAFEIKSDRRGCLASEKYVSTRSYSVAVPRADAPYLKATGYLVYIARLSAPYVGTDSSHDTASLDDPYEVVRNGITVHATVERLAVVDGHGKEWWDCDPLKGPGALPPQPVGDSSEWVRPSDYSSYSWRSAAKGDVGIELKVSRFGSVSSCSITNSSGNADLDRTTCTYAQIRGKFTPATDQVGEEVDGTYNMTVHWGS